MERIMKRRDFLFAGAVATAGLIVPSKLVEKASVKFEKVYITNGPIFWSDKVMDVFFSEQLRKAQEVKIRYFELPDIGRQGIELNLKTQENQKAEFFGGEISDVRFITDEFCYEIEKAVFLSRSREHVFIEGKVFKSAITDKSHWFYV